MLFVTSSRSWILEWPERRADDRRHKAYFLGVAPSRLNAPRVSQRKLKKKAAICCAVVHSEADRPRRLPRLYVRQTPTRGACAKLDGGGEVAVALPAPDAVGRDAEAIGDLHDGEVGCVSHERTLPWMAIVNERLRYSRRSVGLRGLSEKIDREFIGGTKGGTEDQTPIKVNDFRGIWRSVEDSNLWPLPSQGSALSS